nr:MAG TPA: hypothetical protein [Caudoviricetes sp.]
MSSSSLRLDRKGRFNRPRTCGVAFALPRESRLGGKIAQGLAVCQPLLIARIGKGRLFSIVELVTVPLDDPRAFFKTAIAFRSDAGGAGFRRVVRGDAGGFGGGCLVFEPGLFRFPCGNERGHVFRVIPLSQRVVHVVKELHVPLPIVPLDGMEVFRCRKVKLQSLSFDYDQTIGRDYRNVLFHILAFR